MRTDSEVVREKEVNMVKIHCKNSQRVNINIIVKSIKVACRLMEQSLKDLCV